MEEKVSVIIPVYNVKRYLKQCLDSIIHQEYFNLEIIIIDDGSTDGSETICEEYSAKDKRIKLIRQENQGAACAKNRGLDNATGKYIVFLDSDDYVDSKWISTMIEVAREQNAEVVECNFVKEYRNHVEMGNNDTYCTMQFSSEAYMRQYLSNWTCSLFWNKLFAAELTERIRFREERRCIDDEFYTYKVISRAKRIARIEEVLYHYRQRCSSVVMNKNNMLQKTEDALEVLIERYEWIKKYFPNLTTIYLVHDIDIMFYFARCFRFTEKTAIKFHRISKYYLWEAVKEKPGRMPVQNAIVLCGIRKKRLLKNDLLSTDKKEDDVYI